MPDAAAQARDAELRCSGSHDIARLSEESVHQVESAYGDELEKTVGSYKAARTCQAMEAH